MESIVFTIYTVALFVFTVFSYGYTDPNLTLSKSRVFTVIHAPLFHLAYAQRPIAVAIFLVIFAVVVIAYIYLLQNGTHNIRKWIIVSVVALTLSYPAFTYDLFNYMTTAKVLYHYHENPYFVMPIEIVNEPNLAFTRAANKLALYGPVWLALSAIPNALGMGNVWATMVAFKTMNAVVYLLFLWGIYKFTKSTKNVLFFALNPLVLFEILTDGHNDIYMMALTLFGLVLLWRKNSRSIIGWLSFIASWFIKGATLLLTPLIFFNKESTEKKLLYAYWIMFACFVIFAPIREELYPWYAVWFISVLSFMNLEKHQFLLYFTIVFSVALELRNVPYMWMGYYEGPGPWLRLAVTVIPVAVFLLIFGFRRFRQHHT